MAAKRAISREKKCFVDYLSYDTICELYNNHYEDYKVFLNYIPKSHVYVINNKDDFYNTMSNLKETINEK